MGTINSILLQYFLACHESPKADAEEIFVNDAPVAKIQSVIDREKSFEKLYSDRPILVTAKVSDQNTPIGDLEMTWYLGEDRQIVPTEFVVNDKGKVSAVFDLPEGDHKLSFRVCDGNLSDSDSIDITVLSPNLAPSCEMIYPSEGAVFEKGTETRLEARISDPDNTIAELKGEWRDDIEVMSSAVDSFSDQVINYDHSWATSGQHRVSLTVMDELGAVGGCDATVNVGVRPKIVIESPRDGTEFLDWEPIHVRAAVTDDDSEMDQIVVSLLDDNGNYFDSTAPQANSLVDFDLTGTLIPGDYSFNLVATDELGFSDEATTTFTVLQDQDQDGFPIDEDCDDTQALTNPVAAEICDSIDNNCDGVIDEGLLQTYFFDGDGDGYGDSNNFIAACDVPIDHAVLDEDCDDAEPLSNPGTAEICDSIDNNCDGVVDEGFLQTYFFDGDGDGYGVSSNFIAACDLPPGHAALDGDCADAVPSINPGAAEICDSIDNNCDGVVDEGFLQTYFFDGDGDGYGDSNNFIAACDLPPGHAVLDGDCADAVPSINPGAIEIPYDGIDQDCDGADLTDVDDDGFDSDVVGGDDCDDYDPFVYPGAVETCGDGIDQDCDGFDNLDNIIPLASADATFMSDDGERAAWNIGNVGDVSGDGRDDLAIEARFANNGPNIDGEISWGRIHLFFNHIAGNNMLANADAILKNRNPGYGPDYSIDSAGDVNGDGYGDMVVGDWIPFVWSGVVYLHYGPLSGEKDVANADASFVGEDMFDHAGHDVAGVGDVNGDGYDDILIGSPYAGVGFGVEPYRRGKAYLYYGPLSGNHDLTIAPNIFLGNGSEDHAGFSVSGAGDVNADGFSDILIGADYANSINGRTGKVYLIHGPTSGIVDLVDANAVFNGENPDDRAGTDISDAGDVDADGYDDALIGAPRHLNDRGEMTGRVYLMSGTLTGVKSLSNAKAIFIGESINGEIGRAVSNAGDVNGDGFDDLLIGKNGGIWEPGDDGAAFLFYGPVSGVHSVSCADVIFAGSNGESAGFDVVSAGDANEDGFDDLLIAAPLRSQSAFENGVAYLIYGGGL